MTGSFCKLATGSVGLLIKPNIQQYFKKEIKLLILFNLKTLSYEKRNLLSKLSYWNKNLLQVK